VYVLYNIYTIYEVRCDLYNYYVVILIKSRDYIEVIRHYIVASKIECSLIWCLATVDYKINKERTVCLWHFIIRRMCITHVRLVLKRKVSCVFGLIGSCGYIDVH